MYQDVLPLLCCPACRGDLTFFGVVRDGRFSRGELRCNNCQAAYPVEDEIPNLLPPGAYPDWDWVVDIEKLETFEAFDEAYNNALPPVVRQNRPFLINRLIHLIDQSAGPILEIATGRGVLLRELALLLTGDQVLVGIDFDRRVLRGTQRYLRHHGLYDPVSLIVMDAKRSAFRSASFALAATWFGFNHMSDAQQSLRECRRILKPDGQLAAATLSVESESDTFMVAEEAGFADFIVRDHFAATLEEAGLQLDRTETFAVGTWPGSPYETLPLKGDKYSHRLVVAHPS